MNRQPAILLVGPTGSGKTPLGQILDDQTLWNRRCCHFDFGLHLRQIAKSSDNALLRGDRERQIILHALETNALLEDDQFPIAREILEAFIQAKNMRPHDLLILNGLPRHLGQAHDTDKLVAMKGVIELKCATPVIVNRVRNNTGGDRHGRSDDTVKAIEQKIVLYLDRTLPLLTHYRHLPLLALTVDLNTQAADLMAKLKLFQPDL